MSKSTVRRDIAKPILIDRLTKGVHPQSSILGAPAAPTYTYGYDGMGRPVSMTDNLVNSYSGTGNVWVQNGQYDPAGHVTSLGVLNNAGCCSYPAYVTQTMAYNHNDQVTSMNWATGWGSSGLAYIYSATQNNGQITQMTGTSGEVVSYAYDALKRLTGATAVYGGSTMWTQAFGYDGFGNMTSKSLNGGANSAPAVDPTTNRLTSGYDANGNMLTGYGLTMTYDERNRMASASQMGGTEYYGYAPDNKRIYRWNAATGAEEFALYGARGERLGTFTWATSGSPQYGFVLTGTNIWFGKKLISNVNGLVMRDRLGSSLGSAYYPYGDEITSTPNGAEKYATYVRDSFTTLDYADQRYYASSYGRFNTADQYMASAGPGDPGSWNRYAYVSDDPVNNDDPSGQITMGCQAGFCADPDSGFGYYWNSYCKYDPATCMFIPPSRTILLAQDPTLPWEPTCSGSVTGKDGAQYDCLHRLGTDWSSLLSDLGSLASALMSDPTCEGWLTSIGGGAKLDAALNAANARDIWELASNIVGPPQNGQPYQGNVGGSFSSGFAPIVINQSVYGNQLDIFGNYRILIHELGHYMGVLLPNDGGNDPTSQANQAQNNKDLLDNCNKTGHFNF